jgi:hypothetical protein
MFHSSLTQPYELASTDAALGRGECSIADALVRRLGLLPEDARAIARSAILAAAFDVEPARSAPTLRVRTYRALHLSPFPLRPAAPKR